MRQIGSCALEMAFVAAGRATLAAHITPKEWDVAAGKLMVEEAGGHTCSLSKEAPLDIECRTMVVGSTQALCEATCDVLSYPRDIDLRLFD